MREKRRGGARPGAGRKPTGGARVTVTLYGELAERVRTESQGKPTRFVREAVAAALKWHCES